MNNIVEISIGNNNFNVYMSDSAGIFDASSVVHKHNYAEIHIISGGQVSFNIQGKEYICCGIIAIPGETFHSWSHIGANMTHYAFQTNFPVTELKLGKLNQGIADGFFYELSKLSNSNDYTMLSAYFNFICTVVCDVDPVKARRNTDYGFLVHEFFNNRYSEAVKLSDLANELHLSERQTERIVISKTGRTFKRYLAHIRVSMAKMLVESTDISMTDVARYVGYKSYAGFWKAYNKSI